MKKPLFRFKQFDVAHDQCAMKVNTDGVLLGAWAEVNDAKSILDIGTGTGVIALMLAQRNSEAIIDAIDIDKDACKQARENFKQSKWSEQLNVFHSPLQGFTPGKKYDAIISNPPYFIDDFKTGNPQKDIAKHSVALSYGQLIVGISQLLSEEGKVFLVLPSFQYSKIETIAGRENLFITKAAEVIAVEGKPPYLLLVQLERSKKQFSKERVTIQNSDGNFTDEYKLLTKEFYLKF